MPKLHRMPSVGKRWKRCKSERGYGGPWRKLRLIVLNRDLYRCAHCGRKGNEVDHIKAKRDGGEDTLDNLQTLCKPCHSKKTMDECGWHECDSNAVGGKRDRSANSYPRSRRQG